MPTLALYASIVEGTMTIARRLGIGTVLALALVCGAAARSGGQGHQQFQAALQKEMVAGDLEGAIAAYRAIAARSDTDRELAATALMRTAECYRKLGDARVRQVLGEVARKYGDLPMGADARKQMAQLDRTVARPRDATSSMLIWSGPQVTTFLGGHVSRDGRWLPYTDWSSGNLMLRDLNTGRERPLTEGGRFTSVKDQQYAGYSRVSPDGRQVVFAWFNGERYDIRTVSLASEGIPRARTLYSSPDVAYVQPFDWSPDGAVIAVELQRPDRSGQIALVATETGVVTTLKSFAWRDESTHAAFSPDGLYLGYDLPAEAVPGERDVFAIAVNGSRELQVTSHRKDDRFVGWSRDGTRILFSSDRTGHVQLWFQEVPGLELRAQPQVIASDFSGQALGMSGDTLYDLKVTRTGSAIRTVAFDFAQARAISTPSDPGEELFSINLRAQAEWSPDGSALAVVRRDRGGPVGMVISIVDSASGLVRTVRPHLNQLGDRVVWSRDSRSFLAAGLDLNDRPGLFAIDADSGRVKQVGEMPYGPASGIALAADGNDLYFRRVTASTVAIIVRDLTSGADRELVSRARTSSLPDDLMRPGLSPDGRRIATLAPISSTEGAVIVADVDSGSTIELLRGAAGDLTFVMWAPDSQSAFVRRRNPASGAQLLRIPARGGTPVQVEWTLGDGTREFRVHPDGRRVAYVVNDVTSRSEVRALVNVLAAPAAAK